MKEYNVYVPARPDSWAWLEQLLTDEFGEFTKTTAFHEGAWNGLGVTLQGELRAYSVIAEEPRAKPFFRRLNRRIREVNGEDFLILEKDAPGPQGEPAGERI